MAGTVNHVARAGMKYMYDIQQFDCIDSSRNTTSLLLVLDQLNLLRFHDVDVPESRGHLFDAGSIDSWTVGYGQPLEVMPLERWKTLDALWPLKAKRPRDFAGVIHLCGRVGLLTVCGIPRDPRNIGAADANVGKLAVAQARQFVQALVIALPLLDEADECGKHDVLFQ